MAYNRIDAADTGEPVSAWQTGLAGAIGLVAGALLFALILLVAHSNSERDTAQQRERHSYDVLMLVRGIDSSMAHGEAALGRFVISGKRETGTLYYDDWKQAGSQIHRLAEITADNPPQAALVKRLKEAYDRRGAELAAPATRAFYKQGWAALSLFDKAGKSDAIREISDILDKLEKNELHILGLRSDRAEDRADWSNRLSNLLSGMGVLIAAGATLLGWLAFFALQQHRIARRMATAQSERAELLERAVADRTRELVTVNEQLRQEAATRIEAETQLRQIQKMEAVGQLTGGIAHDFNNMLAVVVGALDLARRRLSRDPGDVGRYIENALEGANRAASLTRRLLSFARAEPLLPEGLPPTALIATMSDLLERTLGERILLNTQGTDTDWLVWVDPHQLENALINLLVNARDAIDSEGTLTIKTTQIMLKQNEVGVLPAGEYVCIAVVDNGCGMEPEVLDRVFEPFFTTKPIDKGTGLGLSQVFGFVRQSHGDVTIRSTLGQGTTVSIYLPRYIGEVSNRWGTGIRTTDAVAALPAEARTVLVVEDDPRVRAATAAALCELGHDPVACSTGEEALAELARRSDINLIVSDVVMPGMTGPELIARVSLQYPQLAILFVTGYAGEAGDTESFANHELLRKPFTINALSAAIDAALRRQLNAPRRLSASAAAE